MDSIATAKSIPGTTYVATEFPKATAELFWSFFAAGFYFSQKSEPLQKDPVLVIPGFLALDATTYVLRRILIHKGYPAYGWGDGMPTMGFNQTHLERLNRRFSYISARHPGKKVILIGHSLGGLLAAAFVQNYPDKVRQVITLGSPLDFDEYQKAYQRKLSSLNMGALYAMVSREVTDRTSDLQETAHKKSPIPFTTIASSTDAIVPSIFATKEGSEHTENLIIRGASHIGLTNNLIIWRVILQILEHSQGEWHPYIGKDVQSLKPSRGTPNLG